MDWIKIGQAVPRIHPKQLVVIAEFSKGMRIALRFHVGPWEEILDSKEYEIHNHYTHYMLVNEPKF